MFSACTKASLIFYRAFQQTALISGISDIIVVKWKDNSYHSSPFLICFGSRTLIHKGKKAKIFINNILIADLPFTVDKLGYLHPMKPTSYML